MNISNASKKRCREYFGYKGIGNVINSACSMLEDLTLGVVISEFISDYDNPMLYNVLLYLIRENGDEKTKKGLSDLEYLAV